MRTVFLTSGEHGSQIDYAEALIGALEDPDVVEVRQVEDGRLKHIHRRDASAPGGWVVINVPESSGR